MILYGPEEYKKDLDNPYFPHINNKERFVNFYNELGKDPVQKTIDYDQLEMRLDFIRLRGKILELGCHWGHNIIQWAKEGFECVGIDCSAPLLEFGKQKLSLELPEVQKRVKFVNCLIEDFIPKEKYDTIVLTETLEHVIDPVEILKKAEECLSEKGFLYVSSPSERIGTSSHVRGVTKQDLITWVARTNLEIQYWVIGIKYINLDKTINDITIAVIKHKKK